MYIKDIYSTSLLKLKEKKKKTPVHSDRLKKETILYMYI